MIKTTKQKASTLRACLDELGLVISPTSWVVWTSELITSWGFGQLLDQPLVHLFGSSRAKL
jgi:hypothetical protein